MGAATTPLFVAAGLMASTVDDRLASPPRWVRVSEGAEVIAGGISPSA